MEKKNKKLKAEVINHARKQETSEATVRMSNKSMGAYAMLLVAVVLGTVSVIFRVCGG